MIGRLSIFTLFTMVALNASAVTIQFPDEELANESVLPVFDKVEAVKDRNVPTAGRFEIGPQLGFLMNEPFFNTTNYGLTASYHFTETHAVNAFYSMMQGGLGKNGEALKHISSSGGGVSSINLDNVPQASSFGLLNYQITPYYGKISLFKDFVLNLSLYGTAGVGMFNIDGGTNVLFDAGLGQKFYINKYMGIRIDLRMLMYNGPNVVNPKIRPASGTELYPAKVKLSDLESTTRFDTHMSIALVFLL